MGDTDPVAAKKPSGWYVQHEHGDQKVHSHHTGHEDDDDHTGVDVKATLAEVFEDAR